jgi:hypothetical protein
MRRRLTVILILLATLAHGCADPAANKTQAAVTNAQPETSKPADSEKLVISPENSKAEFIATRGGRSIHEITRNRPN